MSIDIAFHLFEAKNEYSIPSEPVLSFLKMHGADCRFYEWNKRKAYEISFPIDSLDCEQCTLHLDEEDKAATIFMARPGGDAFKEIAFGLMQKFGYWFLEGGISAIYHVQGSEDDLPDLILENASCHPARISQPDDIWNVECPEK